MKVDSTFEFEKRRNKPTRYDRELMGATLGAMKRVVEVQSTREKRFWDTRMKGKKAAEKAAHKLEITQNIDLIAPAVTRKTQELNVLSVAKRKVKNDKMDTA